MKTFTLMPFASRAWPISPVRRSIEPASCLSRTMRSAFVSCRGIPSASAKALRRDVGHRRRHDLLGDPNYQKRRGAAVGRQADSVADPDLGEKYGGQLVEHDAVRVARP